MDNKVSIRDVLSEAWGIFKQNWLVLVAITIVSLIPSVVAEMWGVAETEMGSGIYEGSWTVTILMGLAGIIFSIFLVSFYIDTAREKSSDIKSSWAKLSPKKALYYVFSLIVVGLAMAAIILPIGLLVGGLVALVGVVLPEIILLIIVVPVGVITVLWVIALSMRLTFGTYTILDHGRGVIGSIKDSWHKTKGHTVKLVVFMLVILAMNFVGLLLIGLGLLVSIPVSTLMMAVFYHKVIDGGFSDKPAAE